MIHLPRQVEYALMVLAEMQQAPEQERFAVRALSDKLSIPFDVAAKAMQGMNRAGILHSIQGKQGGYRIAQDLNSVMLDDLIEAVSPNPALTSCLQHGGSCAYQEHCNIRTSIARLDLRVRALFHEIPVLDLIKH